MQLIDGHKGEAHITAQQVADINAAIYGTGDYILNFGGSFGYTIETISSISISNGVGLMQGRRFCIEAGNTESVTIEAGTTGTTRRDIIVARYTLNTQNLTESISLATIKGTNNSDSDPVVKSTTVIRDGATIHEMPLYRVRMSGASIAGVDKIAETLPNVFKTGGISSDLIAAGSITSAKLAAGAAIANIVAGAITKAKLDPAILSEVANNLNAVRSQLNAQIGQVGDGLAQVISAYRAADTALYADIKKWVGANFKAK